MSRPVLSCRIGVAGAGKTLSCVIFACSEFLPFERGKLISNLPFLPEKIAERFAGTRGVEGPMTAEAIKERFEPIPKEVLDAWAEEQGGPWEYFDEKDLSGAHIMLDEAHNFVGSKHNAKWRKRWQNWIGELRHRGATIELVTQAESKLAKEFKEEAERHVLVINSETRRDPLFGVLGGDWAQLMAKLIPGYGYRVSTIVEEKRNSGGRRFVTEDVKRFARDPHWFELYESHNTPTAGGLAGKRDLQYQILGWAGFAKWFLVRNLGSILGSNITKMSLLAVLLVWPTSRNWMTGLFKAGLLAQRKNAQQSVADKSGLPAPKPAPQPTLAPGGDLVVDANRSTQAISNARSVVARSDALTPDKRDEIIEQLTAAQRSYMEAFELNMQFVGVVGDDLLMRNGERYAIDEPIRDGPLIGRRVKSFDRRRRELVLDDGRRLKLGGVPKSVSTETSPVVRSGSGPGGRPGTGFPAPVRRGPVGPAVEGGSEARGPGGRGPVRGGTANRPGLGRGPVDGVGSRGPVPVGGPGGAAPAAGDSQ